MGTEQHETAIGDNLTPGDALPAFGNFPDTGPYTLPEPSQLTAPSCGAFFWSGRGADGTGIGPITAGGNGAADLIAHGSGATTLESLLEQSAIQPPKWSPNDVHAEHWWSAVSQMSAEHGSGEVHAVIGSNLRPGNVWDNVELPRLMENPNVTRIIVIDPDTGIGIGIGTTVFQRRILARMDTDTINKAVIISISESAIPRVDRHKLIDHYGPDKGNAAADRVIDLVREAVAMPIDWGTMTLAEGVNDIISRFSQRHPELSAGALEEIGRCVGWQLR